MRAVEQVKDQMVWMMLEERSKLNEEKRALQHQVEVKDRDIEALEVLLLFLSPLLCAYDEYPKRVLHIQLPALFS